VKSSHRLGLTLLAGAALGAATILGVQAQGKPPVYAVIEIDQVTDADAFMEAVTATEPKASAAVGIVVAIAVRWIFCVPDAPA
jgi:hypothetical protein